MQSRRHEVVLVSSAKLGDIPNKTNPSEETNPHATRPANMHAWAATQQTPVRVPERCRPRGHCA